jgi:IS5 family transposase
MQAYMAKAQKNRASKQKYIGQNQLTIVGFETPFSRSLNPNNRWVLLAHCIPWDTLVSVYQKQMGNEKTGADGINPRIAIGSMIIKHKCDLSDRETVQQIQENMYMQYFIGYSSFSDEEPFDPSLFVDFRKRLGIEQINEINERILGLHEFDNPDSESTLSSNENPEANIETSANETLTHKGKLITDATACPQDIAYPTDLNLLSDAREKAEELIDELFNPELHGEKPRTYREIARKDYLHTAQKKKKSNKEIRSANRKQLNYLKRDIKILHKLLDAYKEIPFDRHQYKYLLVIQTLYQQQLQMYKTSTHSIDHRIVSIHQPHVRPIVRGKTNAPVEFGAKIQVSLMNGYAFLDKLSWEAFNEGVFLLDSVRKYKSLFGYYPEEVLVDKIYCTRNNRTELKTLGIKLKAKPLGRPKAVEEKHVSPGERNPIEGKFGQAKTAYGMNRIKARLAQTSQSWIATIIMVLNLVKLAGEVPYCFMWRNLTYSAKDLLLMCLKIAEKLKVINNVKIYTQYGLT